MKAVTIYFDLWHLKNCSNIAKSQVIQIYQRIFGNLNIDVLRFGYECK